MVNEKDILISIINTITNLLISINESKNNVNNITINIESLDNNYFIEDKTNLYKTMLDIFYGRDINHLQIVLKSYKELLTNKLNTTCNHEWITDLIDIDPDKSQIFRYCKLCEISKK